MDQRHLVRQLKDIFHGEQVLTNVRKQSNLKFAGSRTFLELDVWIPKYELAFEFQDEYHYVTTWYAHSSRDYINELDDSKMRMAHKHGICVIGVPCWWDGSPQSLGTTIKFNRPDLRAIVKSKRFEIPINPPPKFFKIQSVPGVGELMAASFPMDPNFNESFPPFVWWLGEKYDGIRCCWNPDLGGLYTRMGKQLPVLQTAVSFLPTIFLDSEVWFGRGLYMLTYSVFKSVLDQIQWQALRIIPFDVPAPEVRLAPFEERYGLMIKTVEAESPFAIPAPRVLVQDKQHLNYIIQHIIDDGGEGVILRKRGSLYESGRTSSLIKLKTSYGDKEGIVIGVDLTGVKLKLPTGKMFVVPPDDVKIDKPSVGDVVTFSFDSSARRDLPVRPIVYRVRADLAWDDVLHNYAKERQYLNDHLGLVGFTTQPVGYWSARKMRTYLENYAKKRGLDPLLAETWYNVPRAIFDKFAKVLLKFKSFFNTLQNLFPEIKFDSSAFHRAPWRFTHTRRKFFENFAKANGFELSDPESWCKQPVETLLEAKGASRVMQYHKNSLSQALVDLFPNIPFDKSKLWSQWNFVANRKRFFEEYARDQGFDPFVAEYWYAQPRRKILAMKGAHKIISYHKGSLSKALMDLFPSVKFDKKRLWYSKAWQDETKRRKFFEDFAKQRGVDILSAESWYSLSLSAITSKETIKIITYHKNSVAQAIVDLFPELHLDKSKFWTQWQHAINRKRLFIAYATRLRFDHNKAENWYMQNKDEILAYPGVQGAIAYHKGSVSKALLDLFPNIGLEREKLSPRTSWHDRSSRVKFFENFAKENAFDPHLPDNWYKVPFEAILNEKGAAKVLAYHGDSVQNALMDLFPDIGLYASGFSAKSPKVFMRNFFENFARDYGFNPHYAGDWYLVRIDDLYYRKGMQTVLSFYQYNIAAALVDLFPEIKLEYDKFSPNLYDVSAWTGKAIVKKFFKRFAEAHSFEPDVLSNWYSQSKRDLRSFKGANKVLQYYENDVVKALQAVYPSIVPSKMFARTDWSDKEKRKQFFDEYARNNDFDPNIPANWYSQLHANILAVKGIAGVLTYHRNSITRALLELYPNIGLSKHGFRAYQERNRRQFFEKYAKDHAFSPNSKEAWYSQSLYHITAIKGADSVISHHGNSVQQALIDLFPELGLRKDLFWDNWLNPTKRKSFFERYALDNQFDPLIPMNWYSQPLERILAFEGAKEVLAYHKGNIPEALAELFPTIGIDKSKFKFEAKWNEKANRCHYFSKYATSLELDPLLPETWYELSKQSLTTVHGAYILKKFYAGSISNAALDLFPEIGINKSLLYFPTSWSDPLVRRTFFETYAEENGFDPLSADAWYEQPRDKIMAAKGAAGVMYHHNQNYVKALVDLFPEINIDYYRLWAKSLINRRKFFRDYAGENGFDVSDAGKWYSVSLAHIMAKNGAASVMSYHKNSVPRALIALFPATKFEKSKFSSLTLKSG